MVTKRSSQWQLMPPLFSVAFLSFEMESGVSLWLATRLCRISLGVMLKVKSSSRVKADNFLIMELLRKDYKLVCGEPGYAGSVFPPFFLNL